MASVPGEPSLALSSAVSLSRAAGTADVRLHSVSEIQRLTPEVVHSSGQKRLYCLADVQHVIDREAVTL